MDKELEEAIDRLNRRCTENKDKIRVYLNEDIRAIQTVLNALEKNYISKDKIKNKIKELNSDIEYLSKFKDWKEKDYTNEDIINNCIEVLEELLE